MNQAGVIRMSGREGQASGKSIILDLKASTAHRVMPVRIDGDQVTRVHTIAPTYEARTIPLTDGAPSRGSTR